MVDFMFYRIYPFLLVCLICCHIIIVISYDPLYFCDITCNVSTFICNFVYLNLLFFLISPAKDLSIWCIFAKKVLVLLFFSVVFLVFISLISVLIFIISFSLLTFSLFVFFLISWGVKLGCLSETFLFFYVSIYHSKLLS